MKQLTDDAMFSLWNSHGIDDMNRQEAIAFAISAITEFCRINNLTGEAQTAEYITGIDGPPLQSSAKQCEYTGGECKRRACVCQCQAMQLVQLSADDKAIKSSSPEIPDNSFDDKAGRDWSLLEATQKSLREHMALVKELRDKLADGKAGVEALKMLAFLDGSEDFDGVWFGDRHPTEKGKYWWRKHLRRLFDANP